jgi:NADH-quinone oxidoreductase subunit K
MFYQYLALSGILFTIGVVGVLIRRNVIVIFMCIELMLNAVNLSILAFAKQLASSGFVDAAMNGHTLVIMVMTVAAAEAAVGLALVISIYRRRETVDVEEMNLLKW